MNSCPQKRLNHNCLSTTHTHPHTHTSVNIWPTCDVRTVMLSDSQRFSHCFDLKRVHCVDESEETCLSTAAGVLRAGQWGLQQLLSLSINTKEEDEEWTGADFTEPQPNEPQYPAPFNMSPKDSGVTCKDRSIFTPGRTKKCFNET